MPLKSLLKMPPNPFRSAKPFFIIYFIVSHACTQAIQHQHSIHILGYDLACSGIDVVFFRRFLLIGYFLEEILMLIYPALHGRVNRF